MSRFHSNNGLCVERLDGGSVRVSGMKHDFVTRDGGLRTELRCPL